MDHSNHGSETELYLLRIWKGRSGDDVHSHTLHGKLQHVVSGASLHFDGLSNLPQALQKMMAQELRPPGLAPDLDVTGWADGRPGSC